MKKVLYYLGKKPSSGNDIDGGSICAKQLIETLKKNCELDVAFLRDDNFNFSDKDIKKVSFFEQKKLDENKFINRIYNKEINVSALKNYEDYDIIIVQHISLLFGCSSLDDKFWNKIILFPMFLTQSYINSGEFVPDEYTKEEIKVLNKIQKIITPSYYEKENLVKSYLVNSDKITIIPRGINREIKFHDKKLKDTLNIINIGSIKVQKNQLDSLIVLNQLIERGIKAKLDFVCTIQNHDYNQLLLDYIKDHNLSDHIIFHKSISQNELAALLKVEDIAISTSKWETFGRGIYEGICAGKPTFILKDLKEVVKFIGDNKGVFACDNAIDMANRIVEFLNAYKDGKLNYIDDLKALSKRVDYDHESELLKKYILG